MPRRIDLDERRELLARAVWSTIQERGVGAVSVRTVAAAAGVAVGSLRHVFPTRGDLLQFSAELMVRRATDRITAIPPTGDLVDDGVAMLSELLPLHADSRAELDVNIALIAEAPALPELRAIRDHAHRALGELCEQMVADLAPASDEPRIVADGRRLFALIDGLALHVLAEPESGDPGWAVAILRQELERIAAS